MIRKLLLIAIISIISISSADAQLEYFTASSGIANAKSDATTDGGLTDPELLFVGMVMASYEVPILGTISTDFKIEDGTSNLWVYMFREKDDASKVIALMEIKITLLGYATYEVPMEDLVGLPVDPTKPLPAIWADSDVFASKLSADDDFLTYYYSVTDPDNWVVGLYINTSIPFLQIDEPYWGIVIFEGNDQYACSMHSTDQELNCSGLVSVPEKEMVAVKAYPNPASSSISIDLPQNVDQNNYTIRITNINGQSAMVEGYSLSSTQLNVEVQHLQVGAYFIEFISDKYIYSAKISVVR
jgi:Secretion system C-terminal sorting domain